ncbi:MAG: DUF2877 domain-containing protein [Propionibacteriales bacterium]|nr:DUF2877 domain-containing protein [Propionibacteriales bacterium]
MLGVAPRVQCTGLVSQAVEHLVTRPARSGPVVATTRSAVYLATDDPTVPALAVVTSDAVQVPNAIVLATRAVHRPFRGVGSPASALVGDGSIELGPLTVTMGSSWAPPRPTIRHAQHAAGRAEELGRLVSRCAVPPSPEMARPLTDLAAGLRAVDRHRVSAASHALIGLGPGLTPSGDDVLSGALVTGSAFGCRAPRLRVAAEAITGAAETALGRTPLVSAALLRHAARGECIAELAALLAALDEGAPLDGPLAALLAVGHHSGSDLARGVAIVLAAANRLGPARPADIGTGCQEETSFVGTA